MITEHEGNKKIVQGKQVDKRMLIIEVLNYLVLA